MSGRIYQRDQWGGGVGVADDFTFTASGVTDVDQYKYWFTGGSPQYIDAKGLGGDVTHRIAPPVDGPVTLFVKSVDKADNESTATQEYRFYVRSGNGPKAQWTLDGLAQAMVLAGGAQFGKGAVGKGAVGNALRLSGSGQHAATKDTVLRTDQSFTVASWVQLDQAPALNSPSTAVAQEGLNVSGFFLGYRQYADGGKWEFYTTAGDAPSSGRPADTAVSSPLGAQLGTPTHLAAASCTASSAARRSC